jgi:membrane-associated phospholipid phosphatase
MDLQTNTDGWRRLAPFWVPVLICWSGALVLDLCLPYGREVLFFNPYRAGWANPFFRFCTHLGEVWAYLFFGLGALVVQQYRAALTIGLTGLVNLPLGFFLKDIMAVDRPLTWLEKTGQIHYLVRVPEVELASGMTSFPSGHTMAAFSLYTLLALLTARYAPKWGYLFALLAVLTGISRMFLAQHFLPDVLAGALIGCLVGGSVFRMMNDE